MRYFYTWQEFMRQPENKKLLESKGMPACVKKYKQMQNNMMWNQQPIQGNNKG
jgi:hypothetical protein